ncbi:hypothetical protein BSKO_01774 [Bryopsis sp. KO-2023]|nr:hypothetical protein BSKO_01774 [Bryopsis sp. KO-2023]
MNSFAKIDGRAWLPRITPREGNSHVSSRLSGNRAALLRQHLRPIYRGSSRIQVKASQEEPPQGTTVKPKPIGNVSLTGKWRKQPQRSTPMDEAYDMVQFPWILRKAVDLLPYMEVESTPERFKTVLKAGGVLDIVETYSWTGEEVEHPRRDKRYGRHLACVVSTAKGPTIKSRWGNPYRGWCTDTFDLSEDGLTLTVRTHMEIVDSGRKCDYNTVYTRVHK